MVESGMATFGQQSAEADIGSGAAAAALRPSRTSRAINRRESVIRSEVGEGPLLIGPGHSGARYRPVAGLIYQHGSGVRLTRGRNGSTSF